MDEDEAAFVRDGDRDDVMRSDAEHDAIIACPAEHQLVVAPPGTGKTFLSIRLAASIAAALPDHARVLRAMRAEARAAEAFAGEVEVRDLSVYDRIAGVA